MKRIIALSLSVICGFGLLSGCGVDSDSPSSSVSPNSSGVTIEVVTTYAGKDSNAPKYQAAVSAWESSTGNQVSDASVSSDEEFKANVIASFEAGTEPDVLFFFNGVDSNSFVEAGKVVSISEIRREYPDYAANMKDGMLGASPADGDNYSVPVNGYWEGLFINKTVLAASGVALPGADYTWEQFLIDCQAIQDAGYTPIAAALGDIPHYWFEFSIYNHLSPATHNILPEDAADNPQYRGWLAGLTDIKYLYECGYFPANTTTAADGDTFQMFMEDEAAFLVDGSWKIGNIEDYFRDESSGEIDEEALSNFTVSFFPGKGERRATDIIGALSSGYYITRKAWDDPAKREAAVSFVMHMTSDAVVADFAGVSATALKNPPPLPAGLSSLGVAGMEMVAGATGVSGAVQDQVPLDARTPIFGGMEALLTGEREMTDAISDVISRIQESSAEK